MSSHPMPSNTDSANDAASASIEQTTRPDESLTIVLYRKPLGGLGYVVCPDSTATPVKPNHTASHFLEFDTVAGPAVRSLAKSGKSLEDLASELRTLLLQNEEVIANADTGDRTGSHWILTTVEAARSTSDGPEGSSKAATARYEQLVAGANVIAQKWRKFQGSNATE